MCVLALRDRGVLQSHAANEFVKPTDDSRKNQALEAVNN